MSHHCGHDSSPQLPYIIKVHVCGATCTQLIKHSYKVLYSSPSSSMIETVAAELGPTCTPLEMRSSGMDRSSWKDSMASIKISSIMATVNSALV